MTDLPGHSTSGDIKMSILSAIPVLLLGLVVVWFLWPMVVDPLTRRVSRPQPPNENDRLAEHLFDRWRESGSLAQPDRG